MTVRTRAALLALFPDNTTGDAEPVDVRDLIDSLAIKSEVAGLRVDSPPYAPTLFGGVNYDQEFTQQTVLTGTELGSPATPTALVEGALRIVGGSSGSADVKGREWPCPPSTAFKMTAKLRKGMDLAIYNTLTPSLRAGTSGSGAFAGVSIYRAAASWTAMHANLPVYASLTSRTSVRNDGTVLPVLPYYYTRIVYDGTNLTYQISWTGHDDEWNTFGGPETVASVIGSAPGRFVIAVDTFSANPRKNYVDWVRFTT